MIQNQSVLIVGVMKNEGPYILEWVAHHLGVGVDGFLIFTNDCDDLTDRILDRLGKLIPMTHQPNPKSLFPDKGNWQVMALRYATLFNVYRDAGWIYHTDADEFLYVHTGDGQLDDLAAAAGDFDAVSLTSMPFGSSGHLHVTDGFVTDLFTRHTKSYAQIRDAGKVAENAIKTLFRNSVRFDLRRNHRPLKSDFSASGLRWIDGSGTTLAPDFTDGTTKIIAAEGSTCLAQFNHYAIKSAEAFLIKVDRGDVAGDTRLEKHRKYWTGYNADGDTDTRFATKSPRFHAIYDALRADPLLAEMHEESIARHRAKAARILATPSGQDTGKWLGLID